MLDIESFCDRFKFGDIEDIFITIYSYFIIGFLILFTIYEQNFLVLDFHVQFLLSIAISLPVTLIPVTIESLTNEIDKIHLEVDGGINRQTCKKAIISGAEVLVAGSSVFNSEDPEEEIRILKAGR